MKVFVFCWHWKGEKMKKRILVFLTLLFVCFGITGCQNKDDNTKVDNDMGELDNEVADPFDE